MQYLIEPIGASFTKENIETLTKRFNYMAQQGYKFHSVFQVVQPPGCLGIGQPTSTYLAVYVKE